MNSHSNKTKLKNFMQMIWNEGDFSSLEEYVAHEYSVSTDEYDPWSGQTINHEIFKERVLYSRNAFPDLNFDIQEMIEEDNNIAINWIMSGTHLGDLPQLSASGRKFSIAGMTIYYFRENKVSGHSQCFDQFSFLKQMGLLG